MLVGVGRIVLNIQDNNSLKGKRRIIRSVIERLKSKFHISAAEVDDNDAHKRAVIGVAVVSNETSHADSMLANIINFVEHLGLAQVVSFDTEVIHLGEADISKSIKLSNDTAWKIFNEPEEEW